MEIESSKTGFKYSLPRTVKDKVVGIAKNATKIGKDDPRKVVHCAKVGLALTLNSLFYYYKPLYDGFGQSGIWAVLTVVVVFEFTVGGTLSKSVNRGCATLLAVSLGTGVVYLAQLCGHEGQPFFLGIVVFLFAALSTFTRFIPGIKKKYDYGVVIFILTFSMITVSGYRVEAIVDMAYQRLVTVAIGGSTCIIISLLICPAWAGDDLRDLVAGNIEKLAVSLEGFGNAHFGLGECDEDKGGGKAAAAAALVVDCKSVLSSQASEESLATFAWWEIRHCGLTFNPPLKQYLKVGLLARECASHILTLSIIFSSFSHPQKEEQRIEMARRIKEPCMLVCSESSKALRELSSTIKTMTHPSPAIEAHLHNSKSAVDDLIEAALQASSSSSSSMGTNLLLLHIVPALTVASLLTDLGGCIHNLANSVVELSEKAHFKKHSLHRGTVNPVQEDETIVVVIQGGGASPSQDSPETESPNVENLDVRYV
ncbi:hypothetical protein DM860_003402 [Cuscuta australis]|uniref:Aluminum-activated malate transporter n=1 Tax=Cuscuta australis TaxID=267555 RepID=A0A328DKT9_9ASTE|nr:hypothetical protein DM860_003402 [Cuscuta australis]